MNPLDPNWYSVDRMRKHLISFGWIGGSAKLAQVVFHKDSIMVCFPYQPEVEGVVGRYEVSPGEEHQVDLTAGGNVTSQKVKYTHWADGNCHFSQDRRILTRVRNTSAPLTEDPDHLFTLDVQGLSEFERFTTRDYRGGKYGRGYWEVDAEEPKCLHIVGLWKKLREGRQISDLRNPVRLRRGESVIETIALGPPPGSLLGGHVLLVNVELREPIDPGLSRNDFLLMFTGGFGAGLADVSVPSSFLALKYPADDAAELPTLDFVSGTVRSEALMLAVEGHEEESTRVGKVDAE
jgi:hypothetical protein